MTTTRVAWIFAALLAACGGSSGDVDMSASTDFSSSACSAVGGRCIGATDTCEFSGVAGISDGTQGCAAVCCVPLPVCNFPQCDGGTCECPTLGAQCVMSGEDCTCTQGAGGAREWTCSD